MSRNPLPLSVAAVLLAGTATADVPQVAADIGPVHALVSQVMGDLGEPALIIQLGASPHEYSLRPSEAQALQNADLIFWVGEDLTPWMENAIETLAEGATVTSLAEAEGTVLHAFREGAAFDLHDHDDHEADADHADGEEHGHDAHDEDDHEDHAHDEDNADHEEHEDHADHDHAHGDHDPHAWLSPDNAAVWLNVIATQLSAADPENAATYDANAAAARTALDNLRAEVTATLDPVRGRSFIVFHDAYQYFEKAFSFPAAGAISLSDASDPSPARIAEIRQRIAEQGINCVLSEPQFNPGLVSAVMEGSDAKTAVLDPIGSNIETGAGLYPALLRQLATSLADCLAD